MNKKSKNSIKEKRISMKKSLLVVLGLILSLILIEGGLRFGGFVITESRKYKNIKSLRKKTDLRIMCLGESTTACGYPEVLEQVLNERKNDIIFSVINKGYDGGNTSLIREQLNKNLERYRPDIVITMMGINDSTIGNTADDPQRLYKVNDLRIYKLYNLIKKHIKKFFSDSTINKNGQNKAHPREINVDEKPPSKSYFEKLMNNETPESIIEVDLAELYPLYVSNPGKAEQVLRKIDDSERYRLKAPVWDKNKPFLRKAKQLLPDHPVINTELGTCYLAKGNQKKARRYFSDAINIDPVYANAYAKLAMISNDFENAEKLYKKAISLESDLYNRSYYYTLLGKLYIDNNKMEEAEKVLLKTVEDGVVFDIYNTYNMLARLYRKMGKYSEAEIFEKKVNKQLYKEMRESHTYPELKKSTKYNYLWIRGRLAKEGIALVAVQYPVRSLNKLKETVGMYPGVYFVDNEYSFKAAIEKEGYWHYFIDIFAGDFGHMTPQGHRLLAENIANIILGEALQDIR